MAIAPSEVVAADVATPAEEEFERLYQQHVGDVYRYALAVLRNPVDAEDVTQTTFLNAWRAFRSGEHPRAPQNWFLSIAHNVCRVRFRTLARRPKEAALEPDLVADAADDGTPSAQEILDALSELPLNQRAALVMRELEGRSYGEIAQILGVTKPAVETLLFRARKSLRLKASALRGLTAVPVPQSLASFFRNGSAFEASAAAVLGSGLVAKAVAVLTAAGVAAAGATTTLVKGEPQDRRPRVVATTPAAPKARTAGVAANRPAARQPSAEIGAPSRSSSRSRHDDVREAPQSTATGVTRAVVDDDDVAAAAPAAAATPPAPERTETVEEQVVATLPVKVPAAPNVSAAVPVTQPRVEVPAVEVPVPTVQLPQVNVPAATPPAPAPAPTLP